MKPLIVLAGPTAVGKTAASIGLAKRLNGEIISGDSMQIYRGLDIGTAKITKEEMDGIPHHLIDIKDPWESFSVNEFRQLADAAIDDITSRGKIPILVGGTGLYLNSVLYEYHFGDADQDPEYREQLHQKFVTEGPESLWNLLKQQDPVTAEKLHPNDEKRIIRALEVMHVSGVRVSERSSEIDRKVLRYQTTYLALTMPRDILYDRINQRVQMMVDQGLEREVRETLANGTPQDAISMRSIGYRQMIQYLNGEYDFERCVELIQRDTRHFAKRQLTWFRHDENVIWVDKYRKTDKEVLYELLQQIAESNPNIVIS